MLLGSSYAPPGSSLQRADCAALLTRFAPWVLLADDFVYMVFDFYATLGASDDVFHIDLNAFLKFVDDCKLAVPGSQHCQKKHLDQMFVMVNATARDGEADRYNKARALNRQEWLQCLVRIAISRYILTGIMDDVSDYINLMFNRVRRAGSCDTPSCSSLPLSDRVVSSPLISSGSRPASPKRDETGFERLPRALLLLGGGGRRAAQVGGVVAVYLRCVLGS